MDFSQVQYTIYLPHENKTPEFAWAMFSGNQPLVYQKFNSMRYGNDLETQMLHHWMNFFQPRFWRYAIYYPFGSWKCAKVTVIQCS